MVLNMAWDFTVDSDIQLDMAKMLKNKKSKKLKEYSLIELKY